MRHDEKTKWFVCDEPGCGKVIDDYEARERRGKVYCDEHLLNTEDKREYERLVVEPNS